MQVVLFRVGSCTRPSNVAATIHNDIVTYGTYKSTETSADTAGHIATITNTSFTIPINSQQLALHTHTHTSIANDIYVFFVLNRNVKS